MQLRPRENIGLWYHLLSKDKSMGGRVYVPPDSDLWPDDWKNIEYKVYNNAPIIEGEKNFTPIKKFENLEKVLEMRFSHKKFNSNQTKIDVNTLLYICKMSFGETNIGNSYYGNFLHRNHPSGGARYPLEYYLYINKDLPGQNIQPGLYHYNIKMNHLSYLYGPTKEDVEDLFVYPWANEASVYIFMTAVFDRTMRKYGERGYRLILQESGHVGQNIYLLATSLGLMVTSIAGTNDEKIEKVLMIDGKNESLIYSILLG